LERRNFFHHEARWLLWHYCSLGILTNIFPKTPIRIERQKPFAIIEGYFQLREDCQEAENEITAMNVVDTRHGASMC
jgi:hypothetical protein